MLVTNNKSVINVPKKKLCRPSCTSMIHNSTTCRTPGLFKKFVDNTGRSSEARDVLQLACFLLYHFETRRFKARGLGEDLKHGNVDLSDNF